MGRMWQLHLNVEVCVGKEKLNLGFAAVGGGYVIHWWPRGKNPVHFSFLCFFFFLFPAPSPPARCPLG